MPTWRALYRQRLRWQTGTLTALRSYGMTGVTWTNWVRQIFFYLRYFAQVACWVVIGGSLYRHPSLYMPSWVIVMLTLIYAERVITVRKAGRKGMLLAMLLFPEWAYGMFDGLYLMRALFSEITGKAISGGTWAAACVTSAQARRRFPVPMWLVPVRPHRHRGLRRVGHRPAHPGAAQADRRLPP
jgi:hypothetical protein